MVWEDKTTNLNDSIFYIIYYIKINRSNKEDNIDASNAKVLATNIYQVPKRTYIIIKCIKHGIMTYYIN